MAFEREETMMQPEIEASGLEGAALLGVIGIALVLAGSAAMAKRSRMNEAWGLLSFSALVVALLMLPDVSNAWNDLLTEPSSNPPEEEWDLSWPEAWMDTQVVVFELPEETVTVGGLEGHTTVWSLTQHAASQSEIILMTEDTSLGLYLLSINGTSASGWEYAINGERGNYAIDVAAIESTLVLRWSLA
jgi:hypothetical protein